VVPLRPIVLLSGRSADDGHDYESWGGVKDDRGVVRNAKSTISQALLFRYLIADGGVGGPLMFLATAVRGGIALLSIQRRQQVYRLLGSRYRPSGDEPRPRRLPPPRARRAVVSVGVCMVIDVQLICKDRSRRSHDKDRHQSLNHIYPVLSVPYLGS